MSVYNRIARMRDSVAFNTREDLVADHQSRQWLQTILDLCNVIFAFDSQAEVEIVSGSSYVLLPRDYSLASRNDLLAIEFPNSIGSFSLASVPTSSSLPQLKRTPTIRGVLPIPRVTRKLLNGVIRDYLVLSSSPTANVTRTLNYKAKFLIEDSRWEVVIKELLSEGDIISVVVNKPDGSTLENLYTYFGNLFGSTPKAIANNLVALINAATNTTGVKAINNGEVVSIFGATTELDLTISSESTVLEVSFIDSFDNTNSEVSSRVQQYLEGKYKQYLINGSVLPVSDSVIRELSLEAKDLIAAATKGLKGQ